MPRPQNGCSRTYPAEVDPRARRKVLLQPRRDHPRGVRRSRPAALHRRLQCMIVTVFAILECNFLAGSFSAVSKRNFAGKYAFDGIFQALQDLHTFAPLQSQNFSKNRFEKSIIFVKIQQTFCKCSKMIIRQFFADLQHLQNVAKFSRKLLIF